MKVIEIAITKIRPYDHNNRSHSESQIDRIVTSIDEFGWTNPILIDEDGIILAGHGRFFAADKLGFAKVPCIAITGLTDEQKRAYRILDNKLTEDSTWDLNSLELEMGYLEDQGFDLEPFGLDELKDLFPEDEPEIEEDDAPALSEDEPYIKLGDEIQLGKHTVCCGDATKSHVYNVDFMFFSPPYNAGKSEKLSGNTHTNDTKYIGHSKDDLSEEDYFVLISRSLEESLKVSRCVAVNIQQLSGNKKIFWDWVHLFSEHLIDVSVWEKSQAAPAMAANVLTSSFEFVFWFSPQKYPSRAIPTASFRGDKKNILKTESNAKNEFSNKHAAGFPLSFASEILKTGSQKGQKVGDCFLGTGTTLIACEQLGRICYGIEIEPQYCQVIIERYRNHCEKYGKNAEIKVNGEPLSAN